METKRFAKSDESFVCEHCGAEVLPLGYTSRNHCPFCLWSKHLDNNPGDRLNDCGGLMEPIGAVTNPRKGYILTHRCTKCGALRRNKTAHEARIQPDDLTKIIRLTARGGL